MPRSSHLLPDLGTYQQELAEVKPVARLELSGRALTLGEAEEARNDLRLSGIGTMHQTAGE